MGKPIISVVIPCYNASAWIGDCLRSVWEQKINCEVIVIDDGSTDNTFDQAKELLRDYPAVSVVVYQRNQGPAVARNTGLRMAQGKYICFLDVDDEYGREYFATAVNVLESEPAVVATYCRIELVNAHRPVEPWQLVLMEESLPGSLIIRTEAARRVGGFPVDPAFRGRSAGEDIEFRKQLAAIGPMARIEKRFYKYRVQRGSHFDYFLDRCYMEGGRPQFRTHSQEDLNGTYRQAVREYEDEIRKRRIADLIETLRVSIATSTEFRSLQQQVAAVDGNLSEIEGFALYSLAKSWPAEGRVVEIGGFKGRSTCCLASGCKAGRGGKVASIDPQRGSRAGGPNAVFKGTADLQELIDTIAKAGLGDHVEVNAASSTTVGQQWPDPIRLLLIDAPDAYETLADDFLSWSKFLARDGLMILRGLENSPGATRFYNQLLANTKHWKALPRIQGLGILQYSAQ